MKLLFFLGVVFLYFYNLGLNQVWQPNEAFYADGAKNMLKSGDLLTPVYNGEIRLNKPPLTYWTTALSFSLFGVNEFSLRLFQALAGLSGGFALYLFARRFLGEKEALISFLALTLSFQYIANARYTSPEILLTLFVNLSLLLWYAGYRFGKNYLIFFAFISSALGVLTKGPVGFIAPAGVIFIYLLIRDRRELLKLKYYLGTLFVFLLSGWWFLYQYKTNKEVFLEVFLKENVKRIYAMESDPIYYYLLDINVSFLPYSFLVYVALFWALRKKDDVLVFASVWFLTFLVAFSLVKMKLPLYIMPSFPAMALLVGSFLANNAQTKVVKGASLFLTLLITLAVVAGAFLLELNILFLAVSLLLPLSVLFIRRFELAPALAGFGLLLYISGALLPAVEKHRPYREIGEAVRKTDPSIKFYEMGAFHYNLPFYSDRVVHKAHSPSSIKGPALLLVREDLYNCKPLGSWRIYKGSESKFIKFLRDIKRNRNFYTFKLCLIP